MELWIRSQDKMDIMKVESLHIDEIPTFNDVNIICYTSGDKYSNIGNYKNKKRALEILDEIQSLLQPKIIYHQKKPVETIQEVCYQLRQKENMEFQELSTYVYEMPKE